MKQGKLPLILVLSLIASQSEAYGEHGGHRGGGGHERGGREQRGERRGELDLCAQQLGITLPARGSGALLSADQRQQLSTCVQNQRKANQAAEKARRQADLAACAQQLGITLPANGAGSSLTQDQRTQLRACMQQDRRNERKSFQDAVNACLAANGITPPQRGQPHPPIDDATRQKIEICVAQAANQQNSGTATSTDASVSTSTATSTDTTTTTNTSTDTSAQLTP